MTETFTFKTTTETNGSAELLMWSSKFGDGYGQDTPQGINPEEQKWSVTVSGYWDTQVKVVRDWIRARQGETFYWHPRTEDAPIEVCCKKYTWRPNGGDHYTLTMEFEQRYLP